VIDLEPKSSMVSLSEDKKEELRKLCKEDLYFFAKGVLGFDWLVPHIHKPLCSLLSPDNKRLCICLPRGWLKTTLCSQAYPIWRVIQNPNTRVLLIQNTFKNATDKLKVIRSVFESNELFKILFPDILPDKTCSWTTETLTVKRSKTFPEGTFDAGGAGTQVVSRHYDVIIEDDTVAPELDDLGEENLVPTQEQVSHAIGWHRLAPPLLTDQESGQILIVGTRWFEKDLISWIGNNEKDYYKFYTRSCRENEKGEPDEKGLITYPERFGERVLQELKTALGPYLFSCLYYNMPVRSADMVFHLEWIHHFLHTPDKVVVFTTVDPATDPEDAKSRDTDYSVVMTTAKDLDTGYIYVLSYFRERCSPSRLIAEIFNHVRTYNPVKVGVETVAYQKTLLYWIKDRMRKENTFFLVEGITNNKRSKDARIMGLQPIFSSGSIFIKESMSDLVSELLSFPLGAHDDVIDALAMQTEMWFATKVKEKPSMRQEDFDPMSVESAICELRDRSKRLGRFKENLTLDIMETEDSFIFN